MAAKKKVAKVKVVKAIRDDAAAKDAMAIVGKPLKAVNAEIDKIAALPTEGAAQRGMCAAMFAWGLGIKATGKAAFDEALYNERFDNYVAKHWKPHEMPGEGTIKGYRSQYRSFCEAAWAKFDARPAVQENLSIANVQMPWRAARMRDVLKLDGKPAPAKLAEVFKITEAAGTVAVRDGSSVFLSLVNVLVDAAKHKGLLDYLATDTQAGKWLRPALMGATNARNIEANKLKEGSKKRTAYLQSVTMARAALDGKRANVSATGNA